MTGRAMLSAILCVLLAVGGALARGPVKGINYAGKWRNAQWLRAKYRDHAPYMTRIDGKYVDTQRYTRFTVSGEVYQVLSEDEILFDCRATYRSRSDRLTQRIYLKGSATKGLKGTAEQAGPIIEVSFINRMKVWHMGSYKYKPAFPKLIADQPPVDDTGRRRAKANILARFSDFQPKSSGQTPRGLMVMLRKFLRW